MAVLNRLQTLTVTAALLVLAIGCSGATPEPELGARQTEAMEQIERTKEAAGEGVAAELPPTTTDPEAVAAEASAAAAQEPVDRTQPVHFPTTHPENPKPEKPTLFEASEAERSRRQDSPRPASIVIDDSNIGDYAKGGQVTEMVTEGFDTGVDGAEGGDSPAEATDSTQDQETYWRTRVRDSRLAWRAAADRVDELESQVAKLRFDFYAQDDPAYRDGEIKPAWDRAAVDLTQARLRVSDLEAQVEFVLAEGLEAGALPGWLREGIDFEPESSTERPEDGAQSNDFGTAEAIEPPIAEDPPQ